MNNWLSQNTEHLKSVDECDSAAQLIRLISDSSGYVREAAIRRSHALGWPELLVPVAGRLNDWVPTVRNYARSIIMAGIESAPAETVLAILPIVLRLLRSGRAGHVDWVLNFERKVVGIVPVEHFFAGLDSHDVHLSRACFRVLEKYRLIDPLSLAKRTLAGTRDVVLAGEVIQLSSKLDEPRKREAFEAGLQSHFGSVRLRALQGLLALESSERQGELAVTALDDAQSCVRALAIATLKSSHADLGAHYRGILQDAGATAKAQQIALASLASLGSAANLDLIRSFTKAESPVVRLAAFSAWARLDGNQRDDIAALAVFDRSSRVRKFALQLVRNGAYVPYGTIRAALVDVDLPLLFHFSAGNKWDRLECIARISLGSQGASGRKDLLQNALRKWMQQSGMQAGEPSAEQIALLYDPNTIAVLDKLANWTDSIAVFLEMERDRGSRTRAATNSILR